MSRADPRGLLNLGLRLGLGGPAAGERVRWWGAGGVSLLAALLLLHAFAGSNAAAELNRLPLIRNEALNSLQWVVLMALGLPIAGLVGTASRMAAGVRDLRLARLRVLGLTGGQTRVVAAVEAAVPVSAGVLLGAVGYLVTRWPAATAWRQTMDYPPGAYTAGAVGWLVTVLGLPALSVLVAVAPVRGTGDAALGQSRAVGQPPRILWRLGLVVLGAAGVLTVVLWARAGNIPRIAPFLYPTAAACLVVGVFVSVGVVARSVGLLLVRLGRSPASLIAGRRLQQQPVAATRILASVLLGLFMVTVISPLVDTYGADPVHQGDRVAATTGPQILTVGLSRGTEVAVANRILAFHGVTRSEMLTWLYGGNCDPGAPAGACVVAAVGTCWALRARYVVPDCRDHQPAWLDRDAGPMTSIALAPEPGLPGIRVATPRQSWRLASRPDTLEISGDNLFLPASTPGLMSYLSSRPVTLVVSGPGGINAEQQLQEALRAELPSAYVTTTRAFVNYVTARNIILVFQLTALSILLVGLMAYLLAAIDQLLARRASLTSVLVLGVPARTLHAAQAWETLIPLGLSLPAAIGLGWLTGAGLSGLLQQSQQLGPTLGLALGAMLTVVLLGSLLTIVAVPRIDPKAIRRP